VIPTESATPFGSISRPWSLTQTGAHHQSYDAPPELSLCPSPGGARGSRGNDDTMFEPGMVFEIRFEGKAREYTIRSQVKNSCSVWYRNAGNTRPG